MKDRSSSASRVSERPLGFLRRGRHYSTSSNKSSEFESFEDEILGVSSLRRRSSSSKLSKRNLTKNISNSSCDSEVFLENSTTLRVMFLGGSSVGKTSIITQILRSEFSSKHKETLQDMYNGELDPGGSNLMLSIEDTGSSFIQDFPAMAEVSLNNSDAVVLVFSVDDPGSFEEVSKLRDFIFTKRPTLPCVIVGNKTDLERKLPAREIEAAVCLDWECGYAECSAREGAVVRGVFRELAVQAKICIKEEQKPEFYFLRRRSILNRMLSKESSRNSTYGFRKKSNKSL
jgi:small GTP-binding protein